MRAATAILAAALSAPLAGAAEPEDFRIGVFDQAAVFEQTTAGQEMRAKLSTLREQKQKEIEGKESILKSLREKYDNEKLNMTVERRAEMERQIEQEIRNLQRIDEDATREMRSQLGEYQEQFQRETYKVVEQLGREQGFTLILEQSILFYHANAIDITELVVQRFDQDQATGTGDGS